MVDISLESSSMERIAYEPLINRNENNQNIRRNHRFDSCENLRLSSCCVIGRKAGFATVVYTALSSVVTIFGYCYLLTATALDANKLVDVYWGIQASYVGVLIAEFTSLSLAFILYVAIHQENPSMIVPWVLGFIGSISLEALAVVYSNVLRDHINQKFDNQFRVELGFFTTKAIFHIFAISVVVRLYRQFRSGVSWKHADVYEL